MSGEQDPPALTTPAAGAGRPIRLLLVEDHRGFRRALRAVMRLEADLDIVAEVERGDEAGDAAGRARPDVAIVDLDLSEADGVEALHQIRRCSPGTSCLVVTALQDHVEQSRAIAAGALAILHKSVEIPQLLAAVRAIAALSGVRPGAATPGGTFMAPAGRPRPHH